MSINFNKCINPFDKKNCEEKTPPFPKRNIIKLYQRKILLKEINAML